MMAKNYTFRQKGPKGPHPVSEKSLRNLKPIKPGEVRNPKGINRKTPWSTENYKLAAGPLPEKLRKTINASVGAEILTKGATWAQANALRLGISAVMSGVVPASKELRESVEGTAMQRMELTGAEGQPLLPPALEIVFPETPTSKPAADPSRASDASDGTEAKD